MDIFTESHGSAYIVMRAMQQVSENGNFGVSELCNPWTEWLKSGIAHMIVLATWPRMPNFKFGRTGASGIKMYSSRTFWVVDHRLYSTASSEKNN